MRREKNRAGPTSLEAAAMIAQWSLRPRSRARWRWAFSICTMPASTMAPTAMAIPPRDMMLALIPWPHMTMKETRMPRGRVKTAAKALRKWSRKSPQTAATTRHSSTSFSRRWPTARRMRPERS